MPGVDGVLTVVLVETLGVSDVLPVDTEVAAVGVGLSGSSTM